MTDPLLGGKVIITTTSKVKLLQKLRDFMGMKSILIQAKRNPKLMGDPVFLERAMEYLKTNTDFTNMAFWETLSAENRAKAAQCMVLQEVSETRQLRMISTKDNAAIYVILSGTAEVKEGFDGEEHILGPGDMFGNAELFHQVLSDLPTYADVTGDTVLNDRVIFAKMHQGSYLRLSLYDMCKYVFCTDRHEEKVDKLEYAKISGFSWEEMTDDDKFYVKVYLRARNLLNKHLFAFLDAYRLVPKNARMSAYKFYHEYERGKIINLRKHDPLRVFVVIDGGIKVEIEANRAGGDHKISCKRKGRKPMVIKTSSMPIMQFNAGSILFVMDECHDLGIPEVVPEKEVFKMPTTLSTAPILSKTAPLPSSTKSIASKQSFPSQVIRDDSEGSVSMQTYSSVDTGMTPLTVSSKAVGRQQLTASRTKLNKNSKDPSNSNILYNINLVFDTPTTFLMIPHQHFEKILDDEKRIMKAMAEEIKSQLHHSNSTVYNRIKGLDSWIKGGIAFPPPAFDAVSNPVVFDERATLMNTIVPRPSETGLPPVGSFSHSHIIEVDGNSSIESEMSLSLSLSQTGFPSSPMMPNVSGKSTGMDSGPSVPGSPNRGESSSSKKSKLKTLIDKMKSDQGVHLPSYIDDSSLASTKV